MKGLHEAMGQDLGWFSRNMLRDRPYTGQAHTCTGMRGSQEISGITFRDMRDAYIRACCMSAPDTPLLHDEACKGEHAAICENDIYELDWEHIDPVAVIQNMSCEIEKMMGIYPNIPKEPPCKT